MTEATTRQLGFWAVLALVVGNMIGSGIYLLPATLAPLGWNQMLGWLVTIGGALALAVVFARLGARVPLAGGPYAYAQAAFGPLPGFITAWAYWVMTWVGNGAVAVAVVSNLSLLFPVIGGIAGLPALLCLAFIWMLTGINILGVREAGRVQEATTLLKLVPLVALIGLALWLWVTAAPRAPDPGIAVSGSGVAAAVGLTFWGFLGLESATVPADKVADARRTVPRATLLGVALTGLVYLGISGAFALFMPAERAAASPAPVADFLGVYLGPGVAGAVALFAAISAFGTLNGFILLQGEMPRAMAGGGVFPRWFAVESRRGTPLRGHVLSSVLVTGIVLLNYQKGMGKLFEFVASVSLAAGLLAYLMSALAALRLLRDERATLLAALVAAAFTVWAEWGLGLRAIGYGALLVAAGLPVYAMVRSGAASGSAAGRQE
ncbi:amino acid/polyamine/organocation transporter (APC superfamily) [Novosphingobium kunmingense]|uniref:Arginine/agmatine antiporter n=1 Tax=Novosphingobium kunmingense TaxID=1211806 RepID=A0A2N0H6Z9_9SPHN|nr:amino acid permease [Novosphingobium kunmingense]PKB14706.1 amino acid/polyamine/organocation transporter (APC superfamily) [Novosphingobium kunmingense]